MSDRSNRYDEIAREWLDKHGVIFNRIVMEPSLAALLRTTCREHDGLAAEHLERLAADFGSRIGRREGGPSENMVWDEAFALASKEARTRAAAIRAQRVVGGEW